MAKLITIANSVLNTTVNSHSEQFFRDAYFMLKWEICPEPKLSTTWRLPGGLVAYFVVAEVVGTFGRVCSRQPQQVIIVAAAMALPWLIG